MVGLLEFFGLEAVRTNSRNGIPNSSQVLQGHQNGVKMNPGGSPSGTKLTKVDTELHANFTNARHSVLYGTILEDYASKLCKKR